MNAPATLRPSQPPPAPRGAPVFAALLDDHGGAVVVAGSLLSRRVRVVTEAREWSLLPDHARRLADVIAAEWGPFSEAAARELADALDAAAACAEGV